MMNNVQRYIDPFTDFGFKKIFGSEPNKDLLIDFLNELLKGHKVIRTLTYAKNEHLGRTEEYRKAVFDLYCEGEEGEKFIIELQKVKQLFFKDRSIYYATFPIQEQAQKGEWLYELKEIYTIGIMDFTFDDQQPEQYYHLVKLMETQTKRVFYDKLTFIYLEMPKFTKAEQELVTNFDKWLFLLKNLNKFNEIPAVLQERIFRKVFEIAQVSKLTPEEMNQYELDLKVKRDNYSAMVSAIMEAQEKAMKEGLREGLKEGMEKGIEKGLEMGMEKGIDTQKRHTAIKMLKDKLFTLEQIASYTELPLETVRQLQDQLAGGK
jgi:predicted transposase/invertase (TIGR01784 family)